MPVDNASLLWISGGAYEPRYKREIFLETRLDVLPKPIIGKLSGKDAPHIKGHTGEGQ
jgi:hypothetical protein